MLEHVARNSVGEGRSIWVFVEPFFDLGAVILEGWAVDQVLCHVWGDVDKHDEGILDVLDLGVEWHPEVGGSLDLVDGLVEGLLGTWDDGLALINLALEVNAHESIDITDINLLGLIKREVDV